jgi:PPOX class probable F420-dependent enzyme
MSPRRDVSMTREEVESFLTRPLTGVLSTLGRDGAPHAAGMWFAVDDGAIRMWTYAKSQKAVNLRRDPRAALLVEEGTGYSELRGVLVRGRAELVETFDAVKAIGLRLYERYTQPKTGLPADGAVLAEIERQAAKRVGIVLPLTTVASWDHSKL